MYIDFNKYNYSLIPEGRREEYIKRDKEAYKNVLKKWLEKNLDSIVERKWEINELLFLRETSDFIKLLKEAETLYELGFFTSGIALLGVSAEDFTKHLCIKFNEEKAIGMTQEKLLKHLKNKKLLSDDVYHHLDEIRKIRNNCLHYNENFKIKTDDVLKTEAITALNNFKDIIYILLGQKQKPIKIEEFGVVTESMSTDIGSSTNYIKEFDDIAYRMRNATSHLFNLDITFDPNTERVIRDSLYRIEKINLDCEEYGEITLFDHLVGIPVVVDLDKHSRELFCKLELQENDLIYATIESYINNMGMSASWKFVNLKKM